MAQGFARLVHQPILHRQNPWMGLKPDVLRGADVVGPSVTHVHLPARIPGILVFAEMLPRKRHAPAVLDPPFVGRRYRSRVTPGPERFGECLSFFLGRGLESREFVAGRHQTQVVIHRLFFRRQPLDVGVQRRVRKVVVSGGLMHLRQFQQRPPLIGIRRNRNRLQQGQRLVRQPGFL